MPVFTSILFWATFRHLLNQSDSDILTPLIGISKIGSNLFVITVTLLQVSILLVLITYRQWYLSED